MWLQACTLVCVMISSFVCGVHASDPPSKWRHDDRLSGKTFYCDWCKPGEYMNLPCTEQNPTECLPCPWEQYTEHYNRELRCRLCRQCNLQDHEHEHEALPCTAVKNRQCECDDGYYLKFEFCFPHTKCQIGEGVRDRGTPWKNTRCMHCKPGTFSDEVSSTAECKAHTNCTARRECVVRQGNRTRDNLCGACDVNATVTTSSVSDTAQAPSPEDGKTAAFEDPNKSDDTTKHPHPGGLTWGPYWLPYLLLGLVIFIAVITVITAVLLWRDDATKQLPSRLSLTEIFVKRSRASQTSNVFAVGASEPQRPLQETAARLARCPISALRSQRRSSIEIEDLLAMTLTLDHVGHICGEVGDLWRQLAREQLGFSDGNCDGFNHDYQLNGQREIVYQMLRAYVRREEAHPPTVGDLCDALENVGLHHVAVKLRTFARSGH